MEYYLKHHGILGQKWGDRNGPPYPLNASDHSAAERKAGTSGWALEAKSEIKKAKKKYNSDFNKAYRYSNNHPIKSNFTKAGKEKSNALWNEAYDSSNELEKKKNEYKTVKNNLKSDKLAAKNKVKKAKKDYNRDFDAAYRYSQNHVIAANFTKAGKEKSDALWNKAYDSLDAYKNAKIAYKEEVNSLLVKYGTLKL